jgi:CubicO group peptidase (beta-lactamase class C family)
LAEKREIDFCHDSACQVKLVFERHAFDQAGSIIVLKETLMARQISVASRSIAFLLFLAVTSCATPKQPHALNPANLERIVGAGMTATGSRGVAISVIENGAVTYSKSFGVRNGAGNPLDDTTVMYGASLTKAVFAVFVLQLVQEGKLDQDRPLAEYLPAPLPSYSSAADERAYAPWAGLEGDERWRKITARMVLTHSTGFANFAFLEPDGKLRIHFEPGSRYAYSGSGIMLLQFTLERGLGLDVGQEMQNRFFTPLGMTRTSLKWRADFASNLADGFKQDGSIEPHDQRGRVRAAGSMDTTLSDMTRFVAALSKGQLLNKASLEAYAKAQLPIRSSSQFPTLLPEPTQPTFAGLAAGLGVVSFKGANGAGFYKGGHNDSTANTWVCVDQARRCVVILSNDVRSEAAFPAIVAAALGPNDVPWQWEYSGMNFWRAP